MVTVVDILEKVAGVTLGAHTMVTVVTISMILALPVMVCAEEMLVLVGVMLPVLIMVIAAQIMVACVLTITENKLIEKPSKKPTKLLELKDIN